MIKPQRQLLFGVCVGIVWAIVASILLGPSEMAWQSTAGAMGVHRQSYGALKFLQYEAGPATLAGQWGANYTNGWSWRIDRLVFTLILLIVATAVLLLVYRIGVARRGSVGVCDHCGYPMPASPNARCPECGESHVQ
jgi:hypothetical protein